MWLDCACNGCRAQRSVVGHLWERYTEETAALGFSGIYERYLAGQAGFGDDAQGYRAALHPGIVQEASASEE
jgi:hypothetical protein